MKVLYKLETFEGPLDLLLHLIEKAEIDIYDIPVSTITDQYLEYVAQMQELELEVTTEFLVMAATLLSIKSKMLLPKPPPIEPEWEDFETEEEDPRAELVRQLLEYRKYKQAAEQLRDKEYSRSLVYSREPADLTPYAPQVQENPVKGLHVADLLLAFQKALKRQAARQSIATIRRDEISVKDRIAEIVRLLRGREDRTVMFSRLIDEKASREEIVVTFLAILELMKRRVIVCYQHGRFDDIVIQGREEGWTGNDLDIQADEVDY
ncbi:segregation and condensation protein A [Paenibacillus thermoaerophilus]|uniref:Segregation and condensation protein A n=1 Tax=Paenibacillus thermoaerophilus TaxID=1215385 RepID=A0ABW2V7W7_9BACL|nr:segregation/condensation protein A [Paenibacillus thermoaerophilus]TMV07499.1 segregation/condensation protein A [Paenibacillus thermoaerophilus]